MKALPVYTKFDLNLVRAKDCYLYDDKGNKILDFYSGHGVISIGHSNEYYVSKLNEQISRLLYYSNAVEFDEQSELCATLGRVSGCNNYDLFMSNSGAEAIENALKAASYITGRTNVVCMLNSFHGRTSLAAQCTEASKIAAPINHGLNIKWVKLGDFAAAESAIDQDTAAVLIEGIQGVGGIMEAPSEFWQLLSKKCESTGAMLIADEIQSGFGRTGKFFAFQHHNVEPDIICTAKGMGNGYPVSGTLIKQKYKLSMGSLGTTFGGNPLACKAVLSVTEVIEKEKLCEKAEFLGNYLKEGLLKIEGIKEVRGRGLMIAFDLNEDSSSFRTALLKDCGIITGNARNKNTVRILPPLTVTREMCSEFLDKVSILLKK